MRSDPARIGILSRRQPLIAPSSLRLVDPNDHALRHPSKLGKPLLHFDEASIGVRPTVRPDDRWVLPRIRLIRLVAIVLHQSSTLFAKQGGQLPAPSRQSPTEREVSSPGIRQP